MMMNNMFSMFDPSSYYFSSSWMIMISVIFIYKKSALTKNEKIKMLMKSMSSFILKEVNQMINKKSKLSSNILLIIFSSMALMNLIAIFPYNFTLTAHMSISFTVSVSMWLATMMMGWKNQFNKMMVHLTPLGTPNALMNFMVIIETISLTIRPITLSIRLSANMVAGHLLMTLLSSFSLINGMNMSSSTAPMGFLIVLEMGVAMVQAYVFMTLMLLYQNETA